MRTIKKVLMLVLCGSMFTLMALLHFGKMPIAFTFDPNDEKCLPDMHLALLVKSRQPILVHGDYVFWSPAGALSYVRQPYVLKRVAGVPGDHLTIRDGDILINKTVVASGFPLSDVYHQSLKSFERDEVIPQGHVFMIGTHPWSNDSRYWGYLNVASVLGKGYKIL